ncbi:MAG: VCBS repeat-containing protein [Deltaproteobacteria bacterium]|nr:VCBS repeat-containing protein [Deltaproteobacteria bacterium]
MSSRVLLVLIVLLGTLPASAAFAQLLPAFPQCGDGGDCPQDFDTSGDWNLSSTYPPESNPANLLPGEQGLGSGLWADRAWQFTTGRNDVSIAVLDSGIHWENGDLVNKHYINPAELPAPDGYPRDAAGDHRGTYDFNGDGVFNMEDWAEDARITVDLGQNATSHPDGVKDPSDLIAYFSDGVDDDGNGYIDDISGWDFFWNDNNPYDDTRYGHGTGESKDSTAAAGNGGSIGVCPNCMVVNLRVSDSFVADVNNFAQAVIYAVDNGHDVIQEALGTLNNTTITTEAIDYAWDSGVLVVASAADETAYHQNYPGSNHHTLYTHAVRYDTEDREDANTWMSFSNCTNYGPRLDLSAPSTSCSSGAVGVTSGVAGLVVSAGLNAVDENIIDSPLNASELYQLLTRTAVDINLNPDDDQEFRYPSHPGWDRFFGFGRVDAHGAVQRVMAGDIPPHADLIDPHWFQVINVDDMPEFDVVGSAGAPRSASYSWDLQVAGGWDPRDTAFSSVATGKGTEPTDGVLATLSASDFPVDPDATQEPFTADDTNVTKGDKVHVHGATLRLVVTDAEGREAVMRKLIYLQRDPDLLPGYPRRAGTGLESSPKLVDLDMDGQDELLFINSDGALHVTDWQLVDKPGFPVFLRLLDEWDPAHPGNHLAQSGASTVSEGRHAVIGSPAVGDIDGDGDNEIVLGSLNGDLYAWHHDGTSVQGWPFMLDLGLVEGLTDPENVWDYGFFGSPALGDMDNDGDLDVVIGAMDSRVYVLDETATPLPGWPVELRVEFGAPGAEESRGERIISSPAVGDVDDDGFLEVAIGTNQKNAGTYGVGYLLSHDGQIEDGWPAQLFGAYTNALPYVGEGIPGSPSICDLDGDGKLEVAMHTIADPGTMLRWDGTTYARMATIANDFGFFSNSAEKSFAYVFIDSGAFGDFDRDGVQDYFIGTGGFEYANGLVHDGQRYDHDHLLSGWSGVPDEGGATPKMPFLEPFPQIMEDLQFFLTPAIADLDGDGTPEIINGSSGNSMHAFGMNGREPEGWPKPTGQWIIASPTVGDADGDGFLEVWTATRSGYLFAWRTPALAHDSIQEWTSMRHDAANTGNCHVPLRTYPEPPPVEAPADDDDDAGGCGSDVGRGPASGGALVLLALAGLVRLRRTGVARGEA